MDPAITGGDPDNPTISWRRLLVEPLWLVVPPARRKKARLAEAADEPFILLHPSYGLRITTEWLCHEAGFTPRVGFEGEEVETLRGLLGATDPPGQLTHQPATRSEQNDLWGEESMGLPR